MTEQEIVKCLKDNMSKGVSFAFMPKDVWNWVREHLNESDLLYLNPSGIWKSLEDVNFNDVNNFVFCLSETYELPHKSNGEWVEFEINKKGCFSIFNEEKDNTDYFLWCDWCGFLNNSYEYCFDYTSFGGWKYRNCEAWYMVPQMFLDDHYINVAFKGEDNIKPAVPVKIRFWRKTK